MQHQRWLKWSSHFGHFPFCKFLLNLSYHNPELPATDAISEIAEDDFINTSGKRYIFARKAVTPV